MLTIHDQTLITQLEAMAKQEGRNVEDMLRVMIAERQGTDDEGTVPGSWEWINAHLDEVIFRTENPIDADDIEDVLNAEFPDYLLKRMQDGAPEDTH
jgi:alkyl hydroperoxide reductase subunit AhpC